VVTHRCSQALCIELVFNETLDNGVDRFWPKFGANDAEADGSLSVLFVVEIVLCVFEFLAYSSCSSHLVSVGIVLVMRPVCCKAWKCCMQTLSGGGFLHVSVIVINSDSLLHTPDGMALKHALVWMLSDFRCFSYWFGLMFTWNCRFPSVDQTSSVPKCRKNFFDLIDIFGSICTVGVSLLDLSS